MHVLAMTNDCISADGCEMESVLDVGQNISVPCPCQEFLEMVPVIKDQRGWRACAGSYTHGAQLEQSSFTQCTTVAETTSSALCQAVKMVWELNPQGILYCLQYRIIVCCCFIMCVGYWWLSGECSRDCQQRHHRLQTEYNH